VRRSLEFSSVVTREGKWYVASCPELEIASQGKTVELALKNLGEAIELYLKDEDAKVPDVDYRPMLILSSTEVGSLRSPHNGQYGN